MRSASLLTAALLSVAASAAPTSDHARLEVRSVGNCTTNQRKAWHKLSDSEKKAYIDAELCLMNKPGETYSWSNNRWEELLWVHISNVNIVHNVGAFLPWHRYYVHAHEKLLQTECGYTGAQPYWAEALDVGNISASSIFDPDTGFGGFPHNSSSDCVDDGPFTNLRIQFSTTDRTANNASVCLKRQKDDTAFLDAGYSFIQPCANTTTYVDANDCYLNSPHAAGHGGVGGHMKDLALSPADPLFFMHHANLDRLWWQWQLTDLVPRLTDMGGNNVPDAEHIASSNYSAPGPSILDYDGDPGNVTTLNHNLWMVGLIDNTTISEVMDLRGDLICAEYVYDGETES